MKVLFLTCIFLAVGLIRCQHRPIDEMVLADVALKSAQKAKADMHAPDTFRKAENLYLRAKKDYSEGYFDSCMKFAKDARLAAEQAEYHALHKQSQIRDKVDSSSDKPLGESDGGY
ncbi:MAG: hypothetical protein HY537_09645 [Deltaproteobacteria bacterium]|nr:hypothetical protein [Deltaproteobacteria bacterium]